MESHENSSSLIQLPEGKLLEDIPFEDYARADGINAGGLKDILRSPAHYYEARFRAQEKKETKALRFGKLFHFAVLEPHLFQSKAVIVPVFEGPTKDGKMSTRSAIAQEKKKEWFAALKPGSIICEQDELTALLRMCDKILSHPLCRELLSHGVKETTLVWEDEVFGTKCKIRPDFIAAKGFCCDLKSVEDASPDAFWPLVKKYRWDLSASHYISGGKATKTFRPDGYFFIAIEKSPPYEIAIYSAGTSILFAGDNYRERAMKTYVECLKKNEWPGYAPKSQTLEYPPGYVDWIQREFEEEQELPDFLKEGPDYEQSVQN